jgi:uncharacterized protein YdeI (YjbR/CyaY-like superfamily)
MELGLIHSSGLKMIEIAKQNGNWNALDVLENITIPDDLNALFLKNKTALDNWEKFPRSSKRVILGWIMNAKKAETRQMRIEETVQLAANYIKANH